MLEPSHPLEKRPIGRVRGKRLAAGGDQRIHGLHRQFEPGLDCGELRAALRAELVEADAADIDLQVATVRRTCAAQPRSMAEFLAASPFGSWRMRAAGFTRRTK